MTRGAVFDSNILIYQLNDRLDGIAEQVVLNLLEGPVYMSVITRIEILGWNGHSEESREAADALLSTLTEIGLDEPVVRTTIRIRCSTLVKLPDAIIAASALTLGLPLVTRNVEDFGKIKDLDLINPFASA